PTRSLLESSIIEKRQSSRRAGGQFRRASGRRGTLALVLLLTPLLGEPHGLAHALAQVVQLGPSALAAAPHEYFRDEWGMNWKHALHAFVVDDAPHGEGLVDPLPLLHDHRAGENLHALF